MKPNELILQCLIDSLSPRKIIREFKELVMQYKVAPSAVDCGGGQDGVANRNEMGQQSAGD